MRLRLVFAATETISVVSSVFTVHLTSDNLLSHSIVELLLSCIGLEHTVKVVRLTL